jgi:cytochrome c biogenesis protein ResB
VSQWLLIISPQVIHIGFLFILLAHLMSAISGFKGVTAAREGTVLELPGGMAVGIGPITVSLDSYGYIRDWAVDIEYVAGGKVVRHDRLKPNTPSFFEGLGIYVKDLRAFPDRAVLLELSREPGALWALIGGILFTVGTVTLLVVKMKREG